MADNKQFLDVEGLTSLWGKIKDITPTKTSDITNDSGYITASDVPEGAVASTTTPKMDGTAAVGTETAFARGDHVHPSDTTKVDKEAGKGLSTNDLTDTLKSNYDIAYQYSQEEHAPTDAEKNVIVGIQKNGVDIAVDATTRKVNIEIPTTTSGLTNDAGFITSDDLPAEYSLPVATSTTLGGVKTGSNVSIASDGTLSVADGTVAAKGVVQLSDSTNSDSTTMAATPSAVKAAYDVAIAKQSPATTLSGYGITDAYTKDELDAKLSSAMHYKGTVENYSDLPTDAEVGDMYNVTNADADNNINAGDNVAWNGTSWDVLAGVVDLTGLVAQTDYITSDQIDAICV